MLREGAEKSRPKNIFREKPFNRADLSKNAKTGQNIARMDFDRSTKCPSPLAVANIVCRGGTED